MRLMRMVALAGAGALAWRWWKKRQEEDREYSRLEPPATERPGSTTGMTSSLGARVDQVPAQ